MRAGTLSHDVLMRCAIARFEYASRYRSLHVAARELMVPRWFRGGLTIDNADDIAQAARWCQLGPVRVPQGRKSEVRAPEQCVRARAKSL